MAEPEAVDGYDLGDTDLYPKREVQEVVRDPKTGRFLPPEAVETPRDPSSIVPPPAIPEPPAQPAHQYLIDQALELGYKQSDLDGMSPPAISRLLVQTAKQQVTFRAQQDTARTVADSQTPQRVAPAPVPEPDEFAEALGADYQTNYDPALVGLLKKERADRKALEKRLADREQQETIREQSRAGQLLDDHFEALGPVYEPLFGKGAANDLAKSDPLAMERRIAVLNKAGINLQNVNAKSVAKIRAAADAFFNIKPEPKQAADDPYAAAGNGTHRVTLDQWKGAALARPTQRKGAIEPKGEELATANLERKMQDAGMLGDGEILEGLLGD